MSYTLSCCLIVKNEETRIKSCLDSISILADEIVIIDTGSTDKTENVITQWAKQKNAQNNVKFIKIGNRFHDKDGDFDFGAAKTFSFEKATKNYVMWLDASDVVSDQETAKKFFLKETKKDPNVYFTFPTALTDTYAFVRTRIGKREHSKMLGRIHESMIIYVEKARRVFIPVTIKNSIKQTKRKRRDLKRNLRILKKEWNKEKSARICFYLATSYRELLNLEESLKWFRKRVYDFEFKEEFKEEFFKSLECMAEITLAVGNSKTANIEDLYDISQELIQKDPSRIEGYYYLAQYYIKKSKWKEALAELIKYKICKNPENIKLWLNRNIYSGKAIMKAIERCNTALKYNKILKPESIQELHPTKSTIKRGNSQYY